MSEISKINTNLGSLLVLVVGATGQQGGTVARKLLEKGHQVRALTRNKESHKAKELEKLGAQIIKGDMGDVLSLQDAMKGVDAVFAMTTPYEKGFNFEIKSGFLLEFAVNTTGVKHFIFSSVASSDQNTKIPHFESKYEIESHIQTVDTPYTIIRPVYFMENFSSPWALSGIKEGKISMAMYPDRKLQMISLEDFASMVVFILENREIFLKKTIEIASDEISGKETAEILSRVTGVHIEFRELSYDNISGMGEDFVKTFKWLNEVGYKVDIETLHKKYTGIGWHTFENWAQKQFIDKDFGPVKQKIV
ncbi:MAG: NmrA/HSCARG family protein [Promethearchaeota archaeon]